MSCIMDYLSYYYHYYCVPKKDYVRKNINTLNTLSNFDNLNNINYSSTKVEIDNTYDLLFTIFKNASSKLNIVLHEVYNNGISINNKNRANIFLYNNKIYKINNIYDIKKYLSIIHTIRNYNIKNVIVPENIYYNKLQNEIVQIYTYYPHGDLFDYYVNAKLSYDNKLHLFKLIINIVSNLHNNGIAHRDLKLENFLIYYNESNKVDIILIDLDYCVFINKNDNFIGGTPQYACYEILNDKSIDNWCGADIWSLCIILYIFLFNEFPWNNSHINEVTFIKYIDNYTDDFWHNKVQHLNIPEEHKIVYSKIFNYGFGLNCSERIDINYIKKLLDTI